MEELQRPPNLTEKQAARLPYDYQLYIENYMSGPSSPLSATMPEEGAASEASFEEISTLAHRRAGDTTYSVFFDRLLVMAMQRSMPYNQVADGVQWSLYGKHKEPTKDVGEPLEYIVVRLSCA